MKYFTKEELEDITKELLENPARETLKRLNEKYNGSNEEGEQLEKKITAVNVEPQVVAPIAPVREEQAPVVSPMPTVVDETQVIKPIPNFYVPNMGTPNEENSVNNNITEMSSFELPKLETPVFNNQNNEPVNFDGNLWEVHKQEVNNLMQTTDNFGALSNGTMATEVPVTSAPFFGPSPETVNNPIPVSNRPVQGPTMFGQLEQNYM